MSKGGCPFRDGEVVIRGERKLPGLEFAQWRNGWIHYVSKETRQGGCSSWWEPYRSAESFEERLQCRRLEKIFEIADLRSKLNFAEQELRSFELTISLSGGIQP
jgi:hypothetical protein